MADFLDEAMSAQTLEHMRSTVRRDSVSTVKRTKTTDGPLTASDGLENSQVLVEKEIKAAVGAHPMTSRFGYFIDRAQARIGIVQRTHEAAAILILTC